MNQCVWCGTRYVVASLARDCEDRCLAAACDVETEGLRRAG